MYSQRFTFVPIYGKQAAVRQAVEETARALQAAGIRAGAFTSVATDHPQAVYGTIQFESLAALQEFRDHPGEAQTRAVQDMGSKLEGLLRDNATALYEILLPLAQPGARSFLQLVTWTPLPGKTYDLQEHVLEIASWRKGQGVNAGVQLQAAGPNANDIDLIVSFSSLEELGAQREKNRSDSTFRERQGRTAALISGPAKIRIVD